MNVEDWPWIWAIRDKAILDWKQGLSDGQIQAQALRQQQLPVEILPGKLYLGNAQSIYDVKGLKGRGITAVLNMAGPLAIRIEQRRALANHGIVYKMIEAKDEPNYPLLDKHWPEAFDFLSNTKHCVVHCVAGINRSALIACAFYMISTRTPILRVVHFVRRQRGNMALGNEGFQEQKLVTLARQHNLLGNPPGTNDSIVPLSPPPMDRYLAEKKKKERANPLDRLAF